MDMEPLQVSIYTASRHAHLPSSTRLSTLMKRCPCCGSELVLLLEKFGEVSHDNSSDSAVIASSPTGGRSQEEVLTGGWYCSHCGLHILPAKPQMWDQGDSYSPSGNNINNSNSPSQENSVKTQARMVAMAREVQALTKSVKEQLGKRREYLQNCQEHMSKLGHSHLALAEHIRKLGQLDIQLLEITQKSSMHGNNGPLLIPQGHSPSVTRSDSKPQSTQDKPWHSRHKTTEDPDSQTQFPSRAVGRTPEKPPKSNSLGISATERDPEGIRSDLNNAHVVQHNAVSRSRNLQNKTPDNEVTRTASEQLPANSKSAVEYNFRSPLRQSVPSSQRARPSPMIAPARSYEILNSSHSPINLTPPAQPANDELNTEVRSGSRQEPEPMTPLGGLSKDNRAHRQEHSAVVQERSKSGTSEIQRHQVRSTQHFHHLQQASSRTEYGQSSRNIVSQQGPRSGSGRPPSEQVLNHLRSHSEERHLDPRRRPIHGRSQSAERVLDRPGAARDHGKLMQESNSPFSRARLLLDPRDAFSESRESIERSFEMLSHGQYKTSSPKDNLLPNQKSAPGSSSENLQANYRARLYENLRKTPEAMKPGSNPTYEQLFKNRGQAKHVGDINNNMEFGSRSKETFSPRSRPAANPGHKSEPRSQSSEAEHHSNKDNARSRSQDAANPSSRDAYMVRWGSGSDQKLLIATPETIKSGHQQMPSHSPGGDAHPRTHRHQLTGREQRQEQRSRSQERVLHQNGFGQGQRSRTPEKALSRSPEKDRPSPGVRSAYSAGNPNKSYPSPVQVSRSREGHISSGHQRDRESTPSRKMNRVNASSELPHTDYHRQPPPTSSRVQNGPVNSRPAPDPPHSMPAADSVHHNKQPVPAHRARLWEKPHMKSPGIAN